MAINYRNLQNQDETTVLLQLINQIASNKLQEKRLEQTELNSQRNFDRLIRNDETTQARNDQKEYDDNFKQYSTYMGLGRYDMAEPFLNLMYRSEKIPGVNMVKSMADLNEDFLTRRQAGNIQQKYLTMYRSGNSDEVVQATNYFKGNQNLEPHIVEQLAQFRSTSFFQNSPIYSDARNSFAPDITAFDTYIKPVLDINSFKRLNPKQYVELYDLAKTSPDIMAISANEDFIKNPTKYIDEWIEKNSLPGLLESAKIKFQREGHSLNDIFQNGDFNQKEAVVKYLAKDESANLKAQNPDITEEELLIAIENKVNSTIPGYKNYSTSKSELQKSSLNLREVSNERNRVSLEIENLTKKVNRKIRFKNQKAREKEQQELSSLQQQLQDLQDEYDRLTNTISYIKAE